MYDESSHNEVMERKNDGQSIHSIHEPDREEDSLNLIVPTRWYIHDPGMMQSFDEVWKSFQVNLSNLYFINIFCKGSVDGYYKKV